jgi:mannose-6-phosphate isomerase-like protein (cupin superfamily)
MRFNVSAVRASSRRQTEVQMSAPWCTGVVREAPDYIAPSGKTEIRLLPSFRSGELTHATLPAGGVSKPAYVDEAEAFYVLRGVGHIWRAGEDGEEVVELRPRRCVLMPPGVGFQYRALASEPLVFIVAVMPQWTPESWHELSDAYWDDQGEPRRALGEVPPQPPWRTNDLGAGPDYQAPDGSEIRLLTECEAGGLAHCTLRAGLTTRAVRHRTVDEIWYVLGGEGDVWRSNGVTEVAHVREGTCLTIPCGASFQFRAAEDAPLTLLIGTFPRWPGSEEAVAVPGAWEPSV